MFGFPLINRECCESFEKSRSTKEHLLYNRFGYGRITPQIKSNNKQINDLPFIKLKLTLLQ